MLTLGVSREPISHSLKLLGIIQKQDMWSPYELKRRNVETKDFFATYDETWVHHENPR